MPQAKSGDKVRVHYAGRLDDGTQFDSSEGSEPLEFEVGGGQVIAGFDDGVTGMEIGEKKTIKIPADQAYGPRHDEMILKAPKDQVPPDLNAEVGQQLQLQHPSGQAITVTVVEITDEAITLDGNHPLAGQDLTFDLELVEIA